MQRFGRDTFKSIKPVLELAPETPGPLGMVVNKALELDPDRRYQTPGDMLTELKIATPDQGRSGRRRLEAGTPEPRGL